MNRCREKSAAMPEREYPPPPEQEDAAWVGRSRGVSKLYRDCSFESFVGGEKIVAYLRDALKTDQSVVLRGPTGCGKTHLGISMLKESDAYQWDRLFATVPELLLKIRSSFNGGSSSEEEIIKEYATVPFLVLDDMGAEKTSEYSITTLYVILDRRVRECLKTVITTNLSQAEIESTFGARIASRLAAMENIKINMPDYRKKR